MMNTKTELDHKFDYRDDPAAARRITRELWLTLFASLVLAISAFSLGVMAANWYFQNKP